MAVVKVPVKNYHGFQLVCKLGKEFSVHTIFGEKMFRFPCRR